MENKSILRSDSLHSEQCDILENVELTTSDHQHYSLVFGVNRHASLHSLKYFSVAQGTRIPDIMHDVLEGMLPLEVKLLLKVCTYTKIATTLF